MDNYTESDVEEANKALQLMGYVAKVVSEPPAILVPSSA